MRVQPSPLPLLTRYRTKFREFLGEAYCTFLSVDGAEAGLSKNLVVYHQRDVDCCIGYLHRFSGVSSWLHCSTINGRILLVNLQNSLR
jgi:hypothetical protein